MSSARLQKKLIILRCKDNALLKALRAEDRRKQTTDADLLANLLGDTSVNNIRRWIEHPKQVIAYELKAWSRDICKTMKIDTRDDLFDDRVRSWEFGRILGLSRTVCKYIADINYNEKHELIQSIVYTEDVASRVTYDLAGIYEIILDIPGANQVCACAMQIRYYLPVDSKDLRKGFRIRCKLLISKDFETRISNGTNVFEYDGYLMNKPNHLYFVFESRSYYGGRRMFTLSFGGDTKRVNSHDYKTGEYLRSEPLYASSRMGGVALLRNLARDHRAITPSSDLSTIEDDDEYERWMSCVSLAKPYSEFDPH